MSLADFHFIRPLWLLSLIPLAGLLWYLIKSHGQESQWQRWIDGHLLSHLLDKNQIKANRLPFWGLAAAWLIATIAAAGPTWEQLPQPVIKKKQSLVILWDMSPSMLAEDIVPDRLTRSRYKLTDLLNAKREGEAALIVYGGEAHVVTPLTDDMATIVAQLPAMEPALMPIAGSNTEMAVESALKLLEESRITAGDILLVTDGVVPQAVTTINELLVPHQHRLSVLAVGTEAGAPVPLSDGFARNANGKLIIDQVNYGRLEKLAQSNGGRFIALRSDNLDVDYLLADTTSEINNNFETDEQKQREYDQWAESGPYLALLLLPLAALAFRRGWLLQLLLPVTLGFGYSHSAKSFEWQDLWQTQDQRAKSLLDAGKAEQAAQLFKDDQWSASALYKNGNYDQAAELFNKNNAEGMYNYGNALAQAGQLQEAINAYDKALELNPDLENAAYNRQVVEQMMQEQQQQQGDGENQESSENSDSSEQNQEQSGDQQQSQDQNGESQSDQQAGQDQEQQNQTENNDGDSESEEQQANEPTKDEEQQQSDQEKLAQNYSDASEQEQQDNQAQQQDEEQSTEQVQQQAQLVEPQEGELTEEQQQALEQWLKQVPDDPSGLLKRKFQHQYRQRRQEYRTGQWQLPSNNAATRL